MKKIAFVLVMVSAAVASSANAPAHSQVGVKSWKLLKRVVPGSWSMKTKKGVFQISYQLISNDSALVENWGVGSPHETETIFFPDHADLLLTHYCARGINRDSKQWKRPTTQ